ncbi:MAG TPA: hypothetical protein VFC82_02255 [Actinomycetaceae bacterium]|nr:hypothetical protein [Actinomycetaceae bacterium]
MSAIQHFLLIYDHGTDRLVEQRDYGGDVEAATEAYAEAEAEYRDNPLIARVTGSGSWARSCAEG